MDVVVTYDIAVNKRKGARRLRQVAQACERYGERVQFSVFECRLSPSRLERMLGEIQDVIDPELDSVVVYRFKGDMEEARTCLGRTRPRGLGEPWIV